MTFDLVALGWQITALVCMAGFVRIAAWHVTASKDADSLTVDLARLRADTTAWLQDQRSAHARILEDHLARIKTLESAVAVSQARISSLEQINEVTKEPQAPGAIGPFLRNRKAGTT